MKYMAWTVLLSGGLLLFACGDDTDTSSSSSSNTTSAGGSGSGGSGGSGSGGDACSAPLQMGNVCDPVAEDGECVACTRSDCCTEVEACVQDAACECVYRCFLAGCDPIGCVTDCPSSDAVTALTQCAVGQCPVCAQM